MKHSRLTRFVAWTLGGVPTSDLRAELATRSNTVYEQVCKEQGFDPLPGSRLPKEENS